MRYSFIIPAVDRLKELQDCILSIEKSYNCVRTNKDISVEIIVVLANPAEKTKFTLKHPDNLRIYIVQGGAAKARNYGTRKSTGEYLIFIDDDAKVADNFLGKLYEITRDKKPPVLCGRILNQLDGTPFTPIYCNTDRKKLGLFDYNYSGGTSLIVRKPIIERIGYFDEELGPGTKYFAGEDSDLFYRLMQANNDIIYVPELVFFHPVDTATLPEKVFKYSFAMGAMFLKQAFSDRRCFHFYLWIISMIIIKSIIRDLQYHLFPKALREKDKRFQYASVYRGLVSGVFAYAGELKRTASK